MFDRDDIAFLQQLMKDACEVEDRRMREAVAAILTYKNIFPDTDKDVATRQASSHKNQQVIKDRMCRIIRDVRSALDMQKPMEQSRVFGSPWEVDTLRWKEETPNEKKALSWLNELTGRFFDPPLTKQELDIAGLEASRLESQEEELRLIKAELERETEWLNRQNEKSCAAMAASFAKATLSMNELRQVLADSREDATGDILDPAGITIPADKVKFSFVHGINVIPGGVFTAASSVYPVLDKEDKPCEPVALSDAFVQASDAEAEYGCTAGKPPEKKITFREFF